MKPTPRQYKEAYERHDKLVKYLIDEGWFEYDKLDYFKNNQDIISAEILGYLRFPTEKKLFTPSSPTAISFPEK